MLSTRWRQGGGLAMALAVLIGLAASTGCAGRVFHSSERFSHSMEYDNTGTTELYDLSIDYPGTLTEEAVVSPGESSNRAGRWQAPEAVRVTWRSSRGVETHLVRFHGRVHSGLARQTSVCVVFRINEASLQVVAVVTPRDPKRVFERSEIPIYKSSL